MRVKLIILLVALSVAVGGCGFNFKQSAEQPAPAPSTYADDLIKVSQPALDAKIASPLVVKGEARGTWFFEASFPIKLIDDRGALLAQGIAQAQSDWMTEEFVPFEARLEFSAPTVATGQLILSKDNPSGLPANDRQIVIPVNF